MAQENVTRRGEGRGGGSAAVLVSAPSSTPRDPHCLAEGPTQPTMPTTQDIVQKLWNLCHVLRDDGITYHEYVTELTFLLFLKMAKETGTERQLPKGYRWDDLARQDGRRAARLLQGAAHRPRQGGDAGRVQDIFANASTSFRQPRTCSTVVENIDALDWY